MKRIILTLLLLIPIVLALEFNQTEMPAGGGGSTYEIIEEDPPLQEPDPTPKEQVFSFLEKINAKEIFKTIVGIIIFIIIVLYLRKKTKGDDINGGNDKRPNMP
jgi:hypothetical protein